MDSVGGVGGVPAGHEVGGRSDPRAQAVGDKGRGEGKQWHPRWAGDCAGETFGPTRDRVAGNEDGQRGAVGEKNKNGSRPGRAGRNEVRLGLRARLGCGKWTCTGKTEEELRPGEGVQASCWAKEGEGESSD